MKKCYLCLVLLFSLPYYMIAQTPCVGGMADGHPCSNANLQSFVALSDLSSAGTNDIWGWTDPMDGKEYAIVGLREGTAFVDISTPTSPVLIGTLPTHTTSSSWRDIKVYNNHAFIVSEASGHGMQVFDLTRLRTATPPASFTNDGHVSFGNGNAHNIVANEETGYMYTVGTRSFANGGLVFIDVSTPTNPVIVGSFGSDSYTHDAVCFNYRGPDTEHLCKEICIGLNEDTYTIVDVSDKSSPMMISRNGYMDDEYTHQGWVTDDHRYLIVNDELDESRNGHNTRSLIFDISDLDSPTAIGFYDHPQASSDHNMYVKGRYVYQSNYTAGVRILDLGDVGSGTLTEVAYFDVFPANDNVGFSGSWSNYPYFRSGNVIATSRTLGFYVFQPTFAHYTMTLESASVLELCPGETKRFTIDLTAYAGFSEMLNLSVSGAPTDLNVNLSTTVSQPDNVLHIDVTADAAAVDGAYSLLLTGIGDDASSEQTLALGVKVQSGLSVAAKVWLQGAYDSSSSMMRDDLRNNSVLPLREPYTLASNFTANLQNENVLMPISVRNITGNNAISDWVMLELRDSTDPSIVLAARAALVQRDGDVVDADGVSPVKFGGMPAGNYYLAVRHRNHLGIMTRSTLTFTANR